MRVTHGGQRPSVRQSGSEHHQHGERCGTSSSSVIPRLQTRCGWFYALSEILVCDCNG